MRRARLWSGLHVCFGGAYIEALTSAIKIIQATIVVKPRLNIKKARALVFPSLAYRKAPRCFALCSFEKLLADLKHSIDVVETIRAMVTKAGRCVVEIEINSLIWTESKRP